MSGGDPLRESIELTFDEARSVYLAVVAAIDALPPGEALDRCIRAQRVLVLKYPPDLPELGEE